MRAVFAPMPAQGCLRRSGRTSTPRRRDALGVQRLCKLPERKRAGKKATVRTVRLPNSVSATRLSPLFGAPTGAPAAVLGRVGELHCSQCV
jgi:hypothetical protein